MTAKNPTHIPVLDGVRGYAALWVMLGHFSTRTGLFVPILESPDIAVGIFMIVSGFLMTQHFFARQAIEPWESPRTWLIFYIRRFFRIAPLYYTLLIPSFLAFGPLIDWQRGPLKTLVNVDFSSGATVDAANILMHLSFLFGLDPRYCDVMAIPDWSIGLEMQFYAVFPFLMLFARRFGVFRFWLVGMLVWGGFRKLSSMSGASKSVLSTLCFLPLSFGYFLIGMLLAWAWTAGKSRFTPQASVLVLLMVVTASFAKGRTTAATGVIFVVASVFIALLLFSEEKAGELGISGWFRRGRRLFGNRVAHFLADVSYGVYLVHMLIMIPALAWLCRFPWFVQQRNFVRFAVLTAMAGPVVYGLAWIVFRVIETPGISAGKTLTGRMRIANYAADDDRPVAR